MTDEIDVIKYKQTIDRLLSRLKVPRQDWDDVRQECYIYLFERAESLEKAENGFGYAEVLCRNRIFDIMRENKKEVITDSLDDPRYKQKSFRTDGLLGLGISEEQLQEAVREIPIYDQYQVIHSIFIEGKTEEQSAKDLGLSRRQVQGRKEKGILAVKKYFEENV